MINIDFDSPVTREKTLAMSVNFNFLIDYTIKSKIPLSSQRKQIAICDLNYHTGRNAHRFAKLVITLVTHNTTHPVCIKYKFIKLSW